MKYQLRGRNLLSDKYKENYHESLRLELLSVIEKDLSPIAFKYGYSETPLESNIKWRPLVLVLGNYSSGKSTLINELLGGGVQETGQAPTDDSFTVITGPEIGDSTGATKVIQERDGAALLNDPEFPFESLKKHGDRFTSHFRFKQVNTPELQELAIIDTPGMLDSISERDRGYNYQEVIGDLAKIADLILVLFDPHKAGTIREAHLSLRNTLPMSTFEDRVIFVLNRIDECGHMEDLLRVYGTLCWNLSQMTGRKDIPKILLTHSKEIKNTSEDTNAFLKLLENQREELRQAIFNAPKKRLDNLASFLEHHSTRLQLLLEALRNYSKKRRDTRLKVSFGMIILVLLGVSVFVLMNRMDGWLNLTDPLHITGLTIGVVALYVMLYKGLSFVLLKIYESRVRRDIDSLVDLKTQTSQDNWAATKGIVSEYLGRHREVSLKMVRKEQSTVKKILDDSALEVRKAINELKSQ